ncbi:MAG: M42 family metallopeptidase [Firmicutes bacterium]|nr:M42 family metallopeptidase [Bacillota bacterium]
MLERLSNAFGVSGSEDEIRNILKNEMSKTCNNITIDTMGNLICFKKGENGYKNSIMLSAHMDEVGFIVSGITKEGYLRFKTVGGIDARVIVAKKVVFQTNQIKGVIGIRPPHLANDDKSQSVNVSDLYIDIGAKNETDARKYIKEGDYACFDSNFITFGNRLIKGKALDDRIGCFTLVELSKFSYPHDIYFVFTVQEEVGCRGAAVAAYNVAPKAALVVEGTTCSDVPGTDEISFATRLGKGAAISLFDRASYSDKGIVNALVRSAKKNKLNYQFKQTTFGGNDAGAIHLSEKGIRTGVISVPCRYIHSPSSVASVLDIESCQNIVKNFLMSEVDEECNF